jgi:UDP-N-acetylmuramoyl-tripeptide--D-alanyl-D-alanine ligase
MTQNKPLWTADELRTATGGALKSDACVNGVAIDSRTIAVDDLFVAITGPNNDGHDYVDGALAGEASLVLISNTDKCTDLDKALIVDDPLVALGQIGGAARKRVAGKVLAVTGSVGKTTTKEILADVLSGQGKVHASVGSFNNHWGVPLSLSRMAQDTDFGIFEIGMNHSGEIAPLSQMVRPDIAIVTGVDAVHMAHFASVAEIADAKAEIFDGMNKGAIAILNKDNEWFDQLSAKATAKGLKILSFGEDKDADARLIKSSMHPHCSCVAAEIQGQAVTFKISVPGHHWVMNSLAVMLAVSAMGQDLALASLKLADMSPPVGRGQRFNVSTETGSFHLFDDSFNASPVSMRAALKNLSIATTTGKGRRVAILGDMLELGDKSQDMHKALASLLMDANVNLVLCVGPLMKDLFDNLGPQQKAYHFETAQELADQVMRYVMTGDAVMVKGSKGSKVSLVAQKIISTNINDDGVLHPSQAGKG